MTLLSCQGKHSQESDIAASIWPLGCSLGRSLLMDSDAGLAAGGLFVVRALI
jgi:hypothetical protein